MDWYTNVWDNVYLGSQLAGIDAKTGKLFTEKALDLLSISDLKNKPVDALSGDSNNVFKLRAPLFTSLTSIC
ncbi:hypothetical protein LOS23_14095 [Enterococcus faecium]|nr:hypothetical protein [Enterococcus faecium]